MNGCGAGASCSAATATPTPPASRPPAPPIKTPRTSLPFPPPPPPPPSPFSRRGPRLVSDDPRDAAAVSGERAAGQPPAPGRARPPVAVPRARCRAVRRPVRLDGRVRRLLQRLRRGACVDALAAYVARGLRH